MLSVDPARPSPEALLSAVHAESRGKLKLRGAFFAISDGVLHLLDEQTGEFVPA